MLDSTGVRTLEPTRSRLTMTQSPEARLRVDAALIGRHQTMVWRYLRFLGAAAPLADDLGQETFLRLIEKPPFDRGEVQTGAWLRTTARNLYFRQGRTPRLGLELLAPEELDVAWLRSNGPGQTDPYRAALRECLRSLPPRAREALALRYGEQSSRREIGEELGIKEEGVKTLLRRSRVDLLECVQRKLEA